jgi:alkylation response protein AidB-like acyl-CoA dehydrogenase
LSHRETAAGVEYADPLKTRLDRLNMHAALDVRDCAVSCISDRRYSKAPMTQFDLTDEQRQIQEMAQQFTAAEITPHAAEWDEKHIFPRDTIRQAAELGFGAIYVSPESGGIGLGRLEAALIMEAMAYGCPATSAFISIHNMVSWMIDRFGSDSLKTKYLPSMVTMERIGSYCLTEPGSGSDAAALTTKAVRDGDHYVVSGSKAFISGGGENDVYVTMVRTGDEGPKGISCLVIEKDMPGVSFGAQERKLGWHAQPTSQVNFDSVRVPVENRVGAEGEGFRFAMMGLDGGRINIGACSLGGAQRCLDEAVAYTKERKQFGQAIADFQATQFTLADMETELQAARTLLYQAAVKVTDNAPDKTRFAAMAKRLATDTGSSVVDRALQLHGGYGYLMDYPIERFWRDLRVHSILEGTNQIMRMIIARDMLRQ